MTAGRVSRLQITLRAYRSSPIPKINVVLGNPCPFELSVTCPHCGGRRASSLDYLLHNHICKTYRESICPLSVRSSKQLLEDTASPQQHYRNHWAPPGASIINIVWLRLLSAELFYLNSSTDIYLLINHLISTSKPWLAFCFNLSYYYPRLSTRYLLSSTEKKKNSLN